MGESGGYKKELISHLDLVIIQALRQCYRVVTCLGEEGKMVTGETNEFGNVTLRADIEAGRAIFDSFMKSRLSVRIVSEEHGKEVITGKNPQLLGVIDELDGSKPYKEGTGRYATMLAIFANIDPFYCDYLVSSILDYENKEIYIATNGGKAFTVKLETGRRRQVRTSGVTKLNPASARIRVDGWFKENLELAEKLGEFQNVFIGTPENSGASCQYYTDLVSGKIDLAIECTRKRNLEIAASYGLVKEAGGIILTLIDGVWCELSRQKYLTFAQESPDRIPVVSVANKDLAIEFANLIGDE